MPQSWSAWFAGRRLRAVALDGADCASRNECGRNRGVIPFQCSPEPPVPLPAGTTRTGGSAAPGPACVWRKVSGLAGHVLHHAIADGVVELVHAVEVVRRLARRPRAPARPPRARCARRVPSPAAARSSRRRRSRRPSRGSVFIRVSSHGVTLRPTTSLRLAGFGRNALP